MDISTLCLVFLLFVSGVICGHRNLYYTHQKRVEAYEKNHPCGEPVETLVSLSEVNFSRKIHAFETISPKATVLHRCNTYTKCIQSGNQCDEDKETVELMFLVTSIMHKKHPDYVVGYAQNHTSCSCQEK